MSNFKTLPLRRNFCEDHEPYKSTFPQRYLCVCMYICSFYIMNYAVKLCCPYKGIYSILYMCLSIYLLGAKISAYQELGIKCLQETENIS